ncbi:MAG: Gfo/Idh/MocA family oxidoreductase [Clostridiales bacterium]|nr:Gfo/Idh/MocA family oxidoreductase [Clostridiales bacterium]
MFKKDKIVGAALIGYGGIGQGWHKDRIRDVDGIELVGVYDIKPERMAAAEADGFSTYPSREALLADENVDIVIVATPNNVHKEIVIDALNSGKNVICEKPVALSSEDLEDMIAAANKNGRLFTVHQNRRWDQDYLTLKKIIKDNSLGKIFNIESRVQGSRGIPGDWRNHKQYGGGMVFDWGVHLLDQALMLMEDSKLLSVYATLTYITTDDCDDGFRATLTFDNGVNFYVEVTTSNFIELPRWYMLGINGSAVITDWDIHGKIVKVTDWENREAVPIQAGAGLTKTMAPRRDDTIAEEPLPYVPRHWEAYYENLVAYFNGKEDIAVTHDQLRRSTKLMEAIFESARKNEVIKFEE